MALKYRVRKLNGSGAYDTLHFETESSLTLRPDGSTTVEASLTTLESNSHAPTSATLGTAADAPAFGETLSVVKSISTNANGHVTGVVTDTITFPALPTYLAYLSTITSDAQAQINAKAPINSPSFTGIPKAPTTAAGDNSTAIATTAYVDGMVNAVLAAADAVCLKGTISGGDTLPTADAGWVYRVLTNGTISGFTAYTGDTITCFVDGTPANTPANWFITHNNDGSGVIGPLSSVNSHVAVFNGTTGKVLKDSGFTIGASVPANAAFTDTVYTHPASHPPSIIVQDASNRFVTDTEKSTWNGKEPAITKNTAFNANFDTTAAHIKMNGTQSVGSLSTVARADHVHPTDTSRAAASHTHTVANINGLQTALDNKVDDSQVLTNVPANALFTDTVYTHPTSHPPSIITQDSSNRFVTDAERTAWNGKAAGSHTHDDRYYTETETDNKLKSYLPLAGGTLTGNLYGKYIVGTWLQATLDNHMANAPATKVAVLDDSGWVYYRTVAELLADLGIPDAASIRATTAVYGTTKLSTSTTSTSKTTAATPYAVKAALDQAKQYTDTAAGKGIDIRVASSQPTDQSANDWWCESLA